MKKLISVFHYILITRLQQAKTFSLFVNKLIIQVKNLKAKGVEGFLLNK